MFPLQKGWVKKYQRQSPEGTTHNVRGYWRNDKPKTRSDTWLSCGLKPWREVAGMLKPKLIDPINTVDELEGYLSGLKAVFGTNKDGWATLPTRFREMEAGIEPGYYGHVADAKGHIEADNRIRYFRAVVDALINPIEIWRHPVGKNKDDGMVFMAPYHFLGEKDKSVVVMVGFRKNKPIIWTTVAMSKWNSVDKQRHGELLFKDYE